MIEGGTAGGSALQLASQRRATADRLIAEARWLETVAADEQEMAEQLDRLPPSYSILHDLKLAGSKGNVDHLVVGPGGAFLIVTRRPSDPIGYRDGQLWAGQASLQSELEAAKVEAALLTQSLATPVVPVVGFLDTVMPATAPAAIGGVLVCGCETVARVITRASHTLLAPLKVADITERALPMLHTPGTVTRAQAPAKETSRNAIVAPVPAMAMAGPMLAAPEESRHRRRAEEKSSGRPHRHRGDGHSETRELSVVPPPPKDESATGSRRSVRMVGAIIVALCLGAVALGTVGRLLWNMWPHDDDQQPAVTSPFDSTPTDDSLPDVPMATGIVLPPISYTPLCPVPGAGWQLVPSWPGNIANVERYDVEVQLLDGSWSLVGSFTSDDTSPGALVGQQPGIAWNVRVVAVMQDGSRAEGEPVSTTAPATVC